MHALRFDAESSTLTGEAVPGGFAHAALLRTKLRALSVIQQSRATGILICDGESLSVREGYFVRATGVHPTQHKAAQKSWLRQVRRVLASCTTLPTFTPRGDVVGAVGIAIADVALAEVHAFLGAADVSDAVLSSHARWRVTGVGHMLREAKLTPPELAAFALPHMTPQAFVAAANGLPLAHRRDLFRRVNTLYCVGGIESEHARDASRLLSSLRAARTTNAHVDSRQQRRLLGIAHPDRLGPHATVAEKAASAEIFARFDIGSSPSQRS